MKADGGILISLLGYFALMSLFAIGGANGAIPEMHRLAVEVKGWMTDRQFADMFALSQITPGPNVVIVALIGYHVAGIAGALVCMLAMCGPACVFAGARGERLGPFQRCEMADRCPGRPGAGRHRADCGEFSDCGAGGGNQLDFGCADAGHCRGDLQVQPESALDFCCRRGAGLFRADLTLARFLCDGGTRPLWDCVLVAKAAGIGGGLPFPASEAQRGEGLG